MEASDSGSPGRVVDGHTSCVGQLLVRLWHSSKRLAFNEDALIGCCSDSHENEKSPLIDDVLVHLTVVRVAHSLPVNIVAAGIW